MIGKKSQNSAKSLHPNEHPPWASLQIPTATGDKLFALEEVEKVPKCLTLECR